MKTTTGLYPNAAKEIAQEHISEIVEGSKITVRTPITDYTEDWTVIDPSKMVMLSNGLAIIPASYHLPVDIVEVDDPENPLDPLDLIDQYFKMRGKKPPKRRK